MAGLGDTHGQHVEPRDRSGRRRLLWVLGVGTTLMLMEVAGAIASRSLVLLADATHYLGDILSVFLAFIAATWSTRRPTDRKTFGFHRGEVVAAFVQALLLWAISAYLLYGVARRFQEPVDVDGTLLAWIGGLTLTANAVLAFVLYERGGKNLNVYAAFLHVLGDVLGSAAALAAGLLIHFKGWQWADPLLTVVVTLLILVFAFRLTRQTLHILLEGTPRGVEPAEVEAQLRAVPGVQDVHDLHLWSLTPGVDSLSAHVVLRSDPVDDAVAHEIHDRIRDAFAIDHVTIQVESPGCPCTGLRHRING